MNFRLIPNSLLTSTLLVIFLVAPRGGSPAWAQVLPAEPPPAATTNTPASDTQAAQPGLPNDELQRLATEAAANRNAPAAPQPMDLEAGNLNVLELLRQGGGIMLVIALISLLVVAVALERFFALRRGKLYPSGLRRQVRQSLDAASEFQPQGVFEAANRYRSVAGRILKDMLLKLGRPLPEVEAILVEASQREADRLYGNVRWLTLAAAVTPLIGLLGTVWGMIIAFHNTTQLAAGSNRAEYLAEGIYVALVTTLGGLAVAIPAAIFAHFFEGRITHMLAVIDDDLRRLLPRFEAQEGRCRFDVDGRGNLVARTRPATDGQPERSGPRGTCLEPAERPPVAAPRPSSHSSS